MTKTMPKQMQITPNLVNLNLEQIKYLIDLVSTDIDIEKRAYEEGYEPYQREYHESKGGYKSETRKVKDFLNPDD